MEQLYPQALFATLGSTTIFVIVLLMEIASLAYLVITILEFLALRHRHKEFFAAIRDGTEADTEFMPQVIFWTYVITTILLTLITGYLFLFEPHLL